MDLQVKFTDRALESIIEEAAIYMCACPGQVASEIRGLRNLIRYQRHCIQNTPDSPKAHANIEANALEAHSTMERCLEQVLEIEGWDRVTLKMPPGLRQLRERSLHENL